MAVGYPTLTSDLSGQAISRRRLYRVTKRLVDVAVAGGMLLMLAPLLLIVALLIRLESPGPIIFRQRRVGLHGQEFEMLKFRTMRPSARGQDRREAPTRRAGDRRGTERRQNERRAVPRDGAPDRRQGDRRVAERRSIFRRLAGDRRQTHKSRRDPRVTRLGRILRRTSIDELPQLVNVLRGDMSLVGPRPELPQIVARYESWQHARHLVTPGLTGWWQVNRDGNRLMHEATELDLYYVRNQGWAIDLQILVRTVKIVAFGTGSF